MPEFFVWAIPSKIQVIEAASEQDAAERFLELPATNIPERGFPPDCFVQPVGSLEAPELNETAFPFWASINGHDVYEVEDGAVASPQLIEAWPITQEELIAAKRLLGWTNTRMALRPNVDHNTLRKFLLGGKVSTPLDASHTRATLEGAGLIFVEENGEGPSVRLKKGKRDGAAN